MVVSVSFKGYDVQYTTVNGYVDMIYVYAYEVTTRTVFIYDTTDYTSHWNDGKPYATFKAYELVDGKISIAELGIIERVSAVLIDAVSIDGVE